MAILCFQKGSYFSATDVEVVGLICAAREELQGCAPPPSQQPLQCLDSRYLPGLKLLWNARDVLGKLNCGLCCSLRVGPVTMQLQLSRVERRQGRVS